MNIDFYNLDRRCLNEKSVKKALKKARKQQKKARKAAEKQAQAQYTASHPADTSDPAAILAFGEAHGCSELAQAWVNHQLGSLQDFKNALAAQSIRIKELFPGGILR
jgi:hypothetical protein